MHLLRRLVPQIGLMTVAGWAWRHRGTVVRVADLAAKTPKLVTEDGTGELVTHARALLALDAAMPTDTSVRVSGIDNGSITLRGDPGGEAVTAAKQALCKLPNVTDVRTDGTSHRSVDEAVRAAASPA